MRADKLRRGLSWTLYALALGLAFEGASRLALSNEDFLRRVGANDDPSWRLRWIARHGAAGRLQYEIDEWHPARGWALKAALRDVPLPGGKVLSSNSRGVRGRREHGDEKAPGTTRILVLGDSFTFGEDVGDDETYSHHLERLLPRTEVINLGVHGYGHDQMLIYLREEGVRYRPDIVILGFLTGDMERNVLCFRDYAKPRFVLEGGKLALRNSPVPPPAEMAAAEKWRSKFADLLAMLWLRYRWKSGAISAETRQLTLAILDEMKSTIEAAGARPAFAYLPAYGEIDRTDPGMTGQERFFFLPPARHPEHVPAALLPPEDEGGRRAQDARALGAARAPHRGGGHPRLPGRQRPGAVSQKFACTESAEAPGSRGARRALYQ